MMSLIPLILFFTTVTVLDDPEPHTITVNITVKTETGDPIENAPVMAYVQAPRAFGMTDAQGAATLQTQLSEDSEEVIAALYWGKSVGLDWMDAAYAEERYFELRDQYYFPELRTEPYEPGMTEVNLEIIAYESIKLTGMVTSPMPEWASDRVQISVRGGIWMKEFPPLEPFEVRGVRKGHPVELFFALYEENAIRNLTLTSDQTQDDLNLGEIQFPEIGTGAVADITVTNQEDLWEPGGQWPMWTRVTLISFDGQTILCYPLNPADSKVVDDLATVQEKEPPSIPPGTYYISPGLFGNRTQLMLLDMIRANQHVLLANTGVPMLVAQEGDGNSITIDAKQVRDSIITAYEMWSN
jgi:hypothetical protein